MSKSSRHNRDRRENEHKRPRNDRSISPRRRRPKAEKTRDRHRDEIDRTRERRRRDSSGDRSRHRRRSRSPRRNESRGDEHSRPAPAPASRWEEADGPRRSDSPPQRLKAPHAVSDEGGDDAEVPNGGRNLQRNLKTSGLLNEEFSTYKGVVIKYNEPPEAAMPTIRWRVYVFKAGCDPEKLYIHRQSAYLVSRDRKIADIPFDHPSISKQHAVLQYRKTGAGVTLYLMDLESANGTYLNGEKVDPRRYYEIMQKDVVKFGYSSRECVFLTEDALNSE